MRVLCAWHLIVLEAELADHRERMARKAEGEWFDVVVEGVDEQEAEQAGESAS